jgi:hypothetical protein
MNKKQLLFIIFISIILCSPQIFCEEVSNSSSTEIYSSIQSLSEFIASDYFSNLSKTNDAHSLVDTIYLRALRNMEYDHSEALLLLTFVTLPFNEFPFEISLFNIEFGIPLPAASDSVFLHKNKNLPKHLFFDSRQNSFGDKDKLAHFFGNAFLAYSISFFNLSKFLGILVELIEDTFSKGGLVDWKDITINHLGELFGSNLDDNENLLPSEILKIYSILFYKHSNI